MSKLVLVNYRTSEAEERATRRKIELTRVALERCARLRQELAKLEPVAGENWDETIGKYRQLLDASQWSSFLENYNRLYDKLPGEERKLETELAHAKAQRLRLQLVSTTLMASATSAEKKQLEAISKSAGGLFGDRFREAQSQINELVRQRLAAPATAAESEMTAGQIALARDLLDSSSETDDRLPATPPAGAVPGRGGDGDRVTRLTDQLSQLDPNLVSVDDLIARLFELPERNAGERSLLIDSIELEVQERIERARRKREIERIIEEALAWLSPFQAPDAGSLRERLRSTSVTTDLATARSAVAEARAWAEAESARLDGERIRSVLVSELQELGYEVNLQGPSWQEGSRITIQKPYEPNYDVELSAAPGGQVQSKVLAYDHPGRSEGVNRRDVEVEQGWCDDLARLNKLLAERGLTAEIALEESPGSREQSPLPAQRERDRDAAAPRRIERKA